MDYFYDFINSVTESLFNLFWNNDDYYIPNLLNYVSETKYRELNKEISEIEINNLINEIKDEINNERIDKIIEQVIIL